MQRTICLVIESFSFDMWGDTIKAILGVLNSVAHEYCVVMIGTAICTLHFKWTLKSLYFVVHLNFRAF